MASSLQAAETQPTTQPSLSAEILSLQIIKPLPPKAVRAATAVPRRYGYNDRMTGIEMLVMFTLADRTIVAANQDALQVETFIDDKYNDLGRGRPEQRGMYASGQSNITEDGHSCVISISGDRAPAAEASRMLIRGTLTLRCTTADKTSTCERFPLRVGKTLNAGPVPLTVRSLSDAGGRGINVEFFTNESIEKIRTVRFFGADKKELQTRLNGRFDSAAQPGRTQSSLAYYLPEVLDEVLVEVVYVEKVEQLAIPVELQVDLGDIQIGRPVASPVSSVSGTGVSSQTPAMQSARFRSTPYANSISRPAVEGPAVASRTQWPPRRNAEWPTTRPAITWPAPRPAIAFPATRPAVAGQATPSGLPIFSDATVSVVGLAVYKAPTEPFRGKWGPQSELLFRPNGGTNLRLMLSVRDRAIVDIDSRNLRVNRFADDTPTELSTALRRSDQNYYYGASSYSLSSDGQQGLLYLTLEDAPASGATRFLLSGDLTAQLGSGMKTEEQKDVTIAVGSVIKAGPLSLTIKNLSAESGSWESLSAPSAIRMSVQSDKPLHTIRSIQFITADGEEIRCTLQKPPPPSSRT
ncbi:MAG TPA: hypothetical protein VHP11_13010 [Tepidisphaeraceae bacterium]|nr:hypothetical protein [Tepidisphaeraceae bacterium]